MGPKSPERDHVEQRTRRRPGRVPTSCAECRRLKLRCDRKVPCESCIKRGCASICPDGSLTAGKGNRMVLANTEELHERIEHLCARIRELEDALRVVQSKISHEPHPLLVQEPLIAEALPSGSSASPQAHPSQASDPPPPTKSEEDSFVEGFGTLTVGPSGETAFLGKTARTEYLINAPSKAVSQTPFHFPRLTERILKAASPAFERSFSDDEVGREVFNYLPPLADAVRLCELYLEHGKYAWGAMTREELFDECLMIVYRAESFDGLKSVHALSLLFVVFALATLQDPSHPPYSAEAHEYYLLAWLSFQFAPVTHQVSLFSVQSLLHIAQYLELSDWELKGSSKAWVHIGLAVDFGYMIGLHLDSSRWRLPPIFVERRRRAFWQIAYLDAWLSFSFGRPPNISLAYIDCGFPPDEDQVTNDEGKTEIGFHHWTWKYTILMHKVMTTAFGAKIPPYPTVIELDRVIRDFPVPQYLRPNCNSLDPKLESPALAVQRWCVLSCKESVLLNLHRCYFAQALHDQPEDLLKHKYAPSVMAAYRSAWRLIEGLCLTVRKASQQISRISLCWSHGLSAAIVMCLLVTKAPKSSLTKSSLEELDMIARYFEEAVPTCPPAAHSLESIQKLRQKAHEAVNNSQSQDSCMSPSELDRLGGKTHLIREHTHEENLFPEPPGPTSAPSSTGRYSFESTPESFPFGSESIEHIHPTIVQDMRVFDGVDPANFNNLFDFPPDSFGNSMPDIQVPDVSCGSPIFNMVPSANHIQLDQGGQYPPPVYGSDPVLDATWQHFMEQLGLL